MTAQDEPVPQAPKPMRLQRFLAQCGLGSRRDCEELISTGRVTIDGVVADQLGTTVEPATQVVTLDGERLKVERKKYFMLNKPSGYLCTAEDPEGRRLVLDLFPEEGPRLFTVGRLDENTTGLIIVTNDGDLAQKLSHPRYRIFRTYSAQVAGQPRPEIYEQLRQGLFFTEGKFRVYSVKPVKKQKDSVWVEIVMTEGQNREIRRLFARVGHKIMKLERQGYGPLRLGRLNRGEYRELTREELAELHTVLQRNRAEEGREPPSRGRAPASAGRPRPRTDERPSRGRPSGRDSGSDRPRRSEFGERGDRGRSFEDRGDRRERPQRRDDSSRGDRPDQRNRSEYGDRPSGARSFNRGEGGGRPQRRDDSSRGDRPDQRNRSEYGDRSGGARSFNRGEGGGRPQRRDDSSRGDRPDQRNRSEYGERSGGARSFNRGEGSGRPQRSGFSGGGDRPRTERGFDAPRGDRRSEGPRGDRRSEGPRGEGGAKGRPRSDSGRSSGGKEGFPRGDRKQSGGGGKSGFGRPASGEGRPRHVPGSPSPRRPGGKPGNRRPPRGR